MSDISFEVPEKHEDRQPTELVVVTLDTQPAMATVLHFEKEVQLLLQSGKSLHVIDQATNEQAVQLGNLMKKIRKELERNLDYFIRPHNDYVKTVRNFFKKYIDPLDSEGKALARKISDFRRYLENERLRKEAEAKKLALDLQKKEEEKAKESADQGAPYQPVTVATPIVPEVAKVTRTSEGSASQRKDWTFEILNPAEVPREYCSVDEKLIRKAVKGGVREIPGVRIYEDYITSFRA